VDAFPGADVVYSYAAPSSGTVTVTVQPQPGFDVGLGLLQPCAPNNCLQTMDRRGDGAPETLTFQATAGNTYYIVVDSAVPAVPPGAPGFRSDGRGGFVLGVSQ
jgi:hypothetical protein